MRISHGEHGEGSLLTHAVLCDRGEGLPRAENPGVQPHDFRAADLTWVPLEFDAEVEGESEEGEERLEAREADALSVQRRARAKGLAVVPTRARVARIVELAEDKRVKYHRRSCAASGSRCGEQVRKGERRG